MLSPGLQQVIQRHTAQKLQMEHDIEDFQMTSKQTVESLANDNKTLDIQIKGINDTQRVISYVLIVLSYGVQEDDSKRTHRRCPARGFHSAG